MKNKELTLEEIIEIEELLSTLSRFSNTTKNIALKKKIQKIYTQIVKISKP